MKFWLKRVLLSMLCLTACASIAQTPELHSGDASNPEIERYLRATYPPNEPGAAVIAVDDGNVVHRGAYGMANIELSVPLQPKMVFHIGSMTKQFTAAAILILQEQGKLSTDDAITKFFPNYPMEDGEIRIEHLLTHTSGISEHIVGRYDTDALRLDLTPDEMIGLFRDKPMYFSPGDEHLYNNSGYILLGAIIEGVTKKSYGDFVRDEIFTPLGLDDSHYGGHQLIANRVSGYEFSDGEYRNATYASVTQAYSAGGLLSSVDDLADWHTALATESLPSVSYDSMGHRFVLNNGEPINYGYGLTFIDVDSGQAIGHGGGYPSFSGIGFHLPEDDVYVAVLSNNAGKQPNRTEVARKVAALVVDINPPR